MEKRDVIIIGGGPAGRTIAHMLHQLGQGLSVTLIKDEKINVNRCAVPYGIPDQMPLEKFQIPNSLVTDFGTELVVDRVTEINTEKKQVSTAHGGVYAYNHLVLSTGSRPLIPPIPGVESEAITPVRSLEDLSALRRLAATGKRAVVVGGGYIGIEVAVVLRQMGLAVTVVEMLPSILMATTEPEFIQLVNDELECKGLRLLTGEKVVEFIHSAEDQISVKLGSGNALPADFVVLSVGVVPNMTLAAEAGIRTSPLGIWVDEQLRTDAQDVYACGDCAQKRSLVTGEPTRGEFGTNAVFMARTVARNILGQQRTDPGVLNANVTAVYDYSLGSAGLTEQMAKDAGLDVLTGYSEVLSKYPMMPQVDTIRTKLVFNQKNRRLIGGSVLRKGNCSAHNIDFISFAIQMGATMDDLLNYQYATHPELAAKPSDNMYVFATKDALGNA
ncbi:pyridine nucleotide-disulfide oxidoreductase [Desulfosarcina widdelii]|uniref:Pyridine nucleotide-disulfide oxidoreductase n=1 Tax=Desulfosarcina widdelii TaxID=947919 RepID=A0A5K7YXS3_9BACT|nr:FAD-dependent oxidoreductase [Desulfosarcina widdelii]BBO74572.1 pyridine nucleotide-disulfide oxidoreductase [Desulfosarcina widdelii]